MSCLEGFMRIITEKITIEKFIENHQIAKILPQEVLEFAEILVFEGDEHVLDANVPMSYFYFFVDGRLKLYQIHENGRALLIQFYEGFNSLGEVELMTEVPCTCSVHTVKPTILMRFPMTVMRQYAMEHPPFLQYVIRSLAEKLVISERHHSYNLIYPVKNRLASYLKAYVDKNDKIVLSHSLQDVSEFIGTTYRQVHRAFQAMEADGILIKKGKQIHVLDKDKLFALAGHIYQTM